MIDAHPASCHEVLRRCRGIVEFLPVDRQTIKIENPPRRLPRVMTVLCYKSFLTGGAMRPR